MKTLRLDLPEEGTVLVDIASALTKLTSLQVFNIKNMADIRGFEVSESSYLTNSFGLMMDLCLLTLAH